MLTFIDNFVLALKCPMNPTDTEIKVDNDHIKTLNAMTVGDHLYITLSYGGRYEIVKYTHHGELSGNTITVERDIEHKGAKNFPRGSCVKIEWTKMTMDEYMAQVGKK